MLLCHTLILSQTGAVMEPLLVTVEGLLVLNEYKVSYIRYMQFHNYNLISANSEAILGLCGY